jgi:predicted nucleic acid-binding protein
MILLDSSVILAFFNEEDMFHDKSVELFKEYEKHGRSLAVSDYILNECLTVMLRRTNLKKSKDMLDSILNYDNLELFHLNDDGFMATIEEFKNQNDGLSFIDCSILWIAKKNGFQVATFDKDLITELKGAGVS